MKAIIVLLLLAAVANAEILLLDNFENGKADHWNNFPKGASIVPDTANPQNHVLRLTSRERLVSKPSDRFAPEANDAMLEKIERWRDYRFSFKVRYSHVPQITGPTKSNHYHMFQFEYLVQPGHNGSNACRVSSWRINNPGKWLIQGPYVYAGRKAQTYPLAEVKAHHPTPGPQADTEWHEVVVQTLADRVLIRVDGKTFFDGKHELNDAGGIAFAATFVPESGVQYIELDDIKVETIKEIK